VILFFFEKILTSKATKILPFAQQIIYIKISSITKNHILLAAIGAAVTATRKSISQATNYISLHKFTDKCFYVKKLRIKKYECFSPLTPSLASFLSFLFNLPFPLSPCLLVL